VSEGEEGSEGLGWVVEVGESVDDWDLRMSGEGFNFRVRSYSSHDSVDHGSEDAVGEKKKEEGDGVRIGLRKEGR